MADKITETKELNIQLLSADGSASRILKVDNPITFSTLTGRGYVEAALAPAFARSTSDTTVAADTFFFYDDNDETIPLTQIGTIEQVTIEKTVRRYD